jgi:flavorubredoxin
MVVYDPESRVAFTSKLFSAHVAPSAVSEQVRFCACVRERVAAGALRGQQPVQNQTNRPTHPNQTPQASSSAFDTYGGWTAYEEHWRYFFDCMLAPVAKQAAAALDKLPIAAAPRASFARPEDFLASLAEMWTKALRTITYGPDAAKPTNGAPADALLTFAVAPQHGPVVRTCLSQLVREYSAWAAAQVEALAASSVAVMYASAYGNTAALAQAISRGVTKGGVAVNTVNLELSSLDEVVAAVKGADGFVIGSPTLGGHMPTQVQVRFGLGSRGAWGWGCRLVCQQMSGSSSYCAFSLRFLLSPLSPQLALGSVLREPSTRQLPCGVFGSFGWSGEAVDEMEGKLKDGGFGFAFDSIRVKFKPSAKARGVWSGLQRRLIDPRSHPDP